MWYKKESCQVKARIEDAVSGQIRHNGTIPKDRITSGQIEMCNQWYKPERNYYTVYADERRNKIRARPDECEVCDTINDVANLLVARSSVLSKRDFGTRQIWAVQSNYATSFQQPHRKIRLHEKAFQFSISPQSCHNKSINIRRSPFLIIAHALGHIRPCYSVRTQFVDHDANSVISLECHNRNKYTMHDWKISFFGSIHDEKENTHTLLRCFPIQKSEYTLFYLNDVGYLHVHCPSVPPLSHDIIMRSTEKHLLQYASARIWTGKISICKVKKPAHRYHRGEESYRSYCPKQ